MTPVRRVDGKSVVRSGNVKPSPFVMEHVDVISDMSRMLYRKTRALDLGCGNGRNSECLKSLGVEVISLDHAPDYGIKFDLENHVLPVFNHSVDVVLMNYVLMFLSEQARVRLVDKVCQALAPTGIVLVEFFNAKDSYAPSVKMAHEMCRQTAEWFGRHGMVVQKNSKMRFLACHDRRLVGAFDNGC